MQRRRVTWACARSRRQRGTWARVRRRRRRVTRALAQPQPRRVTRAVRYPDAPARWWTATRHWLVADAEALRPVVFGTCAVCSEAHATLGTSECRQSVGWTRNGLGVTLDQAYLQFAELTRAFMLRPRDASGATRAIRHANRQHRGLPENRLPLVYCCFVHTTARFAWHCELA